MSDYRDTDTEGGGPRLGDLTKSGDLGPFVDSLIRPIEVERDAYREVAIEKDLALRAARADVEAEATRREHGRRHLRSV